MNLCKIIYPYEECLWTPTYRGTSACGRSVVIYRRRCISVSICLSRARYYVNWCTLVGISGRTAPHFGENQVC
jgi:hypothetical protein